MSFRTRALTKEPISFIFYMYPSPGEYAGPLGFGLWTPLCVGARNDLLIFRKCCTISGQPRNTLAQSLWLARYTPFFVFPLFPFNTIYVIKPISGGTCGVVFSLRPGATPLKIAEHLDQV